MDDKRPDYDYVGQCQKCGAYCEAVVDDPKRPKWTARHVAEMIAEGLIVSRVDLAFVRANFGSCKCGSDTPTTTPMFAD